MTKPLDPANAEQAAYWSGAPGERWTAAQESQDRLFAPITEALLAAAAPRPGERVVDIGCGAGETTLRAAALTGAALGVDVSEPLLARAEARARAQGSPAQFALADATVYPFEPQSADLLLSRFGVMFFADPAASFANLVRALKPGGRVVFVCWQAFKLNPWFVAPYAAAVKHVPAPPRPGPEDPGPFAFAEPERVRRVLSAAGLSSIELTPREFTLDVGAGGGLDKAVANALEIGPASRALDGQPEAARAAAAAEIRAALKPHATGGEVRLGAAVWIVEARA